MYCNVIVVSVLLSLRQKYSTIVIQLHCAIKTFFYFFYFRVEKLQCFVLVSSYARVKHSNFNIGRNCLGYVRNPRSLMEGTETLCRDDIGDLLGSSNHL